MKKILVLYTSVGMGHKYIAQNIAYYLERDGYEVKLHDVFQLQEGALVNAGIWVHQFVNKHLPFIWRWLYFSALVNAIGLPLRVPLAKGNSKNIYEAIKEFNPDAVIATQTSASAAVASLIKEGKYNNKFIIAFSDYHLHKFWLYDDADLYLANTEEQKQEMVSLGVPAQKIAVCGITLQPYISPDTTEVKQFFGMPHENKIVLFASGSLGTGFSQNLLFEYLKQVTKSRTNISVVVLCGKNAILKSNIEAEHIPNVVAIPFTDRARDLYAASDVFLTKPGGLTIAEALQAHANILITHTLPGQEEPNYEYLLERKLVHAGPADLTAANLVTATLQLLDEGVESGETAETRKFRVAVTQERKEGVVVLQAVKNLFHGV